jgi:two-component sensor histidine kinase
MMELTATRSSFPEERLLLRELTHRISNEFASVVSIISFAAAKTESTEARSALTAVMDRLEGYVRVHRALQIPDSGDIVDATAYLGELCRLISLSKLERKNIDLVFAERPLSLRSEQCWILGMIVYELINNAARHAFDEAGGEIRVQIVRVGRLVECHVSDDGIGRVHSRTGRGLRIIQDLAAVLQGHFERKRGPHGSASRVVFPA